MQKIVATLQKFNRNKGWYYVPVSHALSVKFHNKQERGLIAITANVNEVKWNTSLLPMGDGSHFIPIPLKVHDRYGYVTGDSIEVEFEVR